ncbi:MAG: metal ABC transporter permease [Chthoniobacterales bacterium]
MNWFTEPFHYEFMQRALLASILIGFTNGFLGVYVVLRRLSLVADALSHSLLPGLAIATILVGLSPGGMLFGGLIAAVIVAVGGQLISRSSRLKDETAIAALYIIAFAAGIALIKYARVKVDLTHFLFGNILGTANNDLWTSFWIGAVILISLVVFHRPLLIVLFEPFVARSLGIKVGWLQTLIILLIVLAMISSLQAVGVLLSLGLLILPAATIYLLMDSYQFLTWGSGILGMIGAVCGLWISYWVNIPSGTAIIIVLGFMFFMAYLFSPKYGLLTRYLPSSHLHDESLKRWGKNGDTHHH